MKIISNIAGRIWAVWGMVSFIVTFFIIFIPSMITWLLPGKFGQGVFIAISKLWMNVWLRLVGCPVKVKGREHFKKGNVYVVTCNHNSFMDIPLSSPFIPGANKTIAKTSFAKVPLFGFFYMRGSVLVNRNSEKSRRESFDKMRAVLKQGIHMCIYPEGTRNRSSEPMKKFHDGAFKLAVAAQTAVIPTVIFNTKKALPLDRKFYFRPQRLHMHFLEAIPPGNMTAAELREKVFGVMSEYFVNNHP